MKDWVLRLPWNFIYEKATKYSLSPELVASIIMVESSGNKHAIGYEKNWRYLPRTLELKVNAERLNCTFDTEVNGHKMSWGPMQVMGTVAREHGFRGWFPELCSWDVGLEYGCKHVRLKIDKYGSDPSDIYAAYNAGSIIMTKGGQYKNMIHVDRFMRFYRELTDG